MSREIAAVLLRSVSDAARPNAAAHWELELVRWLDEHVARITRVDVIDVADIAFTPQHFDHQRRFLIDAIDRARTTSEHARALGVWAGLIEAHPRDSVQVGRRWIWPPTV